MQHTPGPQWRNCFDFVVTYDHKPTAPVFPPQQATQPFRLDPILNKFTQKSPGFGR